MIRFVSTTGRFQLVDEDLRSETCLLAEAIRHARRSKQERTGVLAVLHLDELSRMSDVQAESRDDAVRQIVKLIRTDALLGELVGWDRQRSRMLLLMPACREETARKRLEDLSRAMATEHSMLSSGQARFTPSIGYTRLVPETSAEELLNQALSALGEATRNLDLRPVRHAGAEDHPETNRPLIRSMAIRAVLQTAASLAAGIGLPFLVYAALGALGFDISGAAYIVVVIALLGTALLICWEAALAMRRIEPPALENGSYPPASAIIVAYLPNEASTIVDTVESMLRADYPGPLQVILAYNSPYSHPVEEELQRIAKRDCRFVPFRVLASTSKAQNVNAAVAQVTGEFVGVFDADHHPDAGSFQRAWRWIAAGYDIVQGHCAVRNGAASWLSRLVAVEFEAMYALCHPGRQRLHHFGIFGGSNGYWRTSLLHRTRMYGSMLTEDIDSSMRVLADGCRIVSDPFLVSRELAPANLKALWHQRMRWAQGWFQVSLKHTVAGLQSPKLSTRQKAGLVHLLVWREIFPWLSLQIFPILAYWTLWEHRRLDWFVPFFVFATVLTLGTGPVQAVLTYRVADPQIRERKAWFLLYFLASCIFYAEFKNTIARVAQVKELVRERQWRVTPRTVETAA